MVPHEPLGGVFGASSVWKLDVTSAPVNANSHAMVKNLASQVNRYYGGVAGFNVYQYNAPIYSIPNTVARHRVFFDDCQNKGYVPPQLYQKKYGAYFRNVPIPADAQPAPGTDSELGVWDRDTDQLWEFWHAHLESGHWHACWGGRIDHVSTSPGYFADGMGVAATGLPETGGAVGIAEVKARAIDHAMSLIVVNAAHYDNFSYPAQRSDGADLPGTIGAIPEGTRFRLDPDLNISKLDLTPVAREIAIAARKYGFIVTDKGGSVAVAAESGSGQQMATGVNPWTHLLGGVPSYDVMKNFPWGRLQALPRDYGKH